MLTATIAQAPPVPLAALEARYDDPDRFASDFLAAEGVVAPLGRDRFSAGLSMLAADGMVICHGFVSPAAVIAQAPAGRLTLQLFSQGDALRIDGVRPPRHGVALYAGGATMVRRSQERISFGVLSLPLAAAGPAVALPAGMRDAAAAEPSFRQAAPARVARVMGLLRAAVSAGRERPGSPAGAAARSALLEAVEEMLGASAAMPSARTEAQRNWRRVVLGAEAFLRANLDRPIYTGEICRALGIAPVTLGEAFRALLGMPPHRYFKLRRLILVRAALRDADQPAPRVKTVALSHGFWHLGHFSRDYLDLFGELPSATLAGARGRIPAAQTAR